MVRVRSQLPSLAPSQTSHAAPSGKNTQRDAHQAG